MRFRSRRPSFRRMVRRARPIVRAASGITLVKRVNVDKATIPDITSSDYDNPLSFGLLECVETMAEGDSSDGSAVADAPLYSRITGIRLNTTIIPGASTQMQLRWILWKDVDSDLSAATVMPLWHSSSETSVARELRKMTLAKGLVVANQSSGMVPLKIFIKRQALRRISPLRETDVIRFAIAKDAPGTTASMNMWGSIYVKANA